MKKTLILTALLALFVAAPAFACPQNKKPCTDCHDTQTRSQVQTMIEEKRKLMDINDDNKVTKDEHDSYGACCPFADTNKDGNLSSQEMMNAYEAMQAEKAAHKKPAHKTHYKKPAHKAVLKPQPAKA